MTFSLDSFNKRFGKLVEIDESKVGRLIKGSWVLGMLDLGNINETKRPESFRLDMSQKQTKSMRKTV